MQTLSTLNYLKVALANSFGEGYDRESWECRINLADELLDMDERDLEGCGEEPMFFRKTLRAIKDYHAGNPSGYIMPLDATASGLQILSLLMGCPVTASRVNLINTGKREDAYDNVSRIMGAPRSILKKPVMTHYYASKEQPKSVFGEGEELQRFYDVLYETFPGAEIAMEIMLGLWQSYAKEHKWKLPDGHTSICKVTNMVSHKIPMRINKQEFGSRAETVCPSKKGISLPANIVQSIDGYINREMVRKANDQHFELLSIHDSFWARPQHMNKVRRNYMDIMRELADRNLLENIARDITGNRHFTIKRIDTDLVSKLDGEYALS